MNRLLRESFIPPTVRECAGVSVWAFSSPSLLSFPLPTFLRNKHAQIQPRDTYDFPPPLPFTFTFHSLSVPTTLCNSSPLLSLYHIIQTSVYLTYKHFENKNEINKRESLFFFFNAINCWLKLDSIQTDLRAWEFPW